MKILKINVSLVNDLGEDLPLAIAVVRSFCVTGGPVIITDATSGDQTVAHFVEGISYKINYWRNDYDMRNSVRSEVLTSMVNGAPKDCFSADMFNTSILKILNDDDGSDAKVLNCIQLDLKKKFPDRMSQTVT